MPARLIRPLVLLTLLAAPAVSAAADRFGEVRRRMVSEYIVREGIKNPQVLEAMRTVPRHEFVPLRLRRFAYQDAALAIGHRQTISPPFIVAYMTETIDPRPTHRVLEIGTGSGYQAAVLSGLVKQVYTIEIVEPLGRAARRRLLELGFDNVEVRIGDGFAGWPEKAPFDRIIVTCSPENVPKPLVEQLRDGGRLLIPLGQRYQQVFHLFEKVDGKLVSRKLIPTLFVPMTGQSERQRKVRPDPLNPALVNGGFEAATVSPDRADHWHYQRQATRVVAEAAEGRAYLRLENHDPGRLAQALQGFPIDGRRVRRLRVTCRRRVHEVTPGARSFEKPTLTVVFFDSDRRPVGERSLPPWTRGAGWKRSQLTLTVPPRAREAILRIGLNGASGRVDVDDILISGRSR